MKKLHVIAIPMTGVGLHGGFRGDTWYRHRINIFKNYTLKSLSNQTNKEFVVWMWFRPEERKNHLTLEIADALNASGIKYVLSFNGLMYHDDKFNKYTLKTKTRNFLMMLWDMWLYKEWKSPRQLWKYTFENKNETLLARLIDALAGFRVQLRTFYGRIAEEYDWVYLTRIDSDDMFHREAVNLIQSQEPKERKALVFDKGYIYNVKTGQVAEWNPPTNPPFHTIIFPAKKFFDPVEHKKYYRDFKTHEDVHTEFDCETLDMNKYMVSVHGKHISTAWDSDVLRKAHHLRKYGRVEPFRGHEIKGYCYTTSGRNISTKWESHTSKTINPMIGKQFEEVDEKKKILSDFGIES